MNYDKPNAWNGHLIWRSIMQPKLPVLPAWVEALLAALAALTGAIIGIITSFEIVHWTAAQTTLVGTEAVAFWAFASAVVAHRWPNTKKQPVAVAGTVTAFVSATLSVGIGFTWWQLSETQNASLIGLVTAVIAVVSALIARTAVIAKKQTPPPSPARPSSGRTPPARISPARASTARTSATRTSPARTSSRPTSPRRRSSGRTSSALGGRQRTRP
jgi:hypothetical protein